MLSIVSRSVWIVFVCLDLEVVTPKLFYLMKPAWSWGHAMKPRDRFVLLIFDFDIQKRMSYVHGLAHVELFSFFLGLLAGATD
ncbi:hypothetical protein KP509_07G025100 [Ceratopteris richardii]|uniref:Secreted protein n=1 Tax=Ceratopteris richardii TaxID=49495 RepID=A0A8T2UFC3_CERRI|nr:hypothetical protein KP509_07G025100 [Ceratopteris richardii]